MYERAISDMIWHLCHSCQKKSEITLKCQFGAFAMIDVFALMKTDFFQEQLTNLGWHNTAIVVCWILGPFTWI